MNKIKILLKIIKDSLNSEGYSDFKHISLDKMGCSLTEVCKVFLELDKLELIRRGKVESIRQAKGSNYVKGDNGRKIFITEKGLKLLDSAE